MRIYFGFLGMCLLAPVVWACNSGTVRDAGFSGPRDTYRLCVFATEENAEMKAAYTRIEAWVKARGSEFNVETEWVNVSAPELDWAKYGMTSEPPTLPVSVLTGFSGQLRRSFVTAHWEPAPTDEELAAFFDSPLLEEAKKQLVEIWAVVLYAPQATPNPAIEKAVSEWSKKNPPGVAFLTLNRKDSREKLLTELGEIAPESPDWAGIVFARGKLKAPMLRGDDLNPESLTRQLAELTEKCTCLQESSVFGLDLPMIWEKRLDERFAALESKAAAYTEITFEKQADAMAKSVEPAKPKVVTAALLPLGIIAALALSSVVFVIWRARRASRG